MVTDYAGNNAKDMAQYINVRLCSFAKQNLSSSRLLSKNLRIKIHFLLSHLPVG